MSFLGIKGTKDWTKWWENREMNWEKDYSATWNHPHRNIISQFLHLIPWMSLLEVGCGSGPNLINILKTHKGKQVGGIDPSESAIVAAQKNFQNGVFNVGSGDDIFMSDSSVDVILTDMVLIYVSPKDIERYLNEMKRVAREYVILCELHHDSWIQRLKLKRFGRGYNAHNYRKLLDKLGFYDIMDYKLKEEDWPGGEPQKTYGHIFLARVPKRK